MQNETEQSVMPYARVMSPNDGSHESILDEMQVLCQYCETPVTCVFVCTGCGIYGHAQCFRLEPFLEHRFCDSCLPKAVAKYASFQDAQSQEAWRRSMESQVPHWRSTITNAIGVISTIGVAIGGAVVAVAGVAAGLAHGVVRGASADSNMPQLALPSASDEQASTAYLSMDGTSEAPSVQVVTLLDGSGQERARAPTTERRFL